MNSCAVFVRKTEEYEEGNGAKRDRTADLLNANQALSQLSYGPRLALHAKRYNVLQQNVIQQKAQR